MKEKKRAKKIKLANIVLIEDEPAHVEIVRRNLATFPTAFNLTHLGDGQAALDYLFNRKARPIPDIILLDLRLPKVDGLEVLRRIRAARHLNQTPIVVLTTSAADRDLTLAMTLGATSYQLKPATFEGFTELLDPSITPPVKKRPAKHE